MINSPLEISNCVIWLDGTDTATLSTLSAVGMAGNAVVGNLSAVGCWANKGSLSAVGPTGNFTNLGGDSTTRPIYIASLSSVRFDGSNDYLTLSATQTYTAETVFVVTSPYRYRGNDSIYSQAASGASDWANYAPLLQAATPLGTVCTVVNNEGIARGGVLHRSLSSFDIFTSRHTGASLINFRNGESSTPYTTNLGTLIALRHRIGASISNTGVAGNNYSGDISEVIVYSRALTNAEREDVEYYLARKWSVLNSIPRQVYALKSGNWSDNQLWSVSADPVPWNFPLSADNVYTNSFTVTADSPTRVDTIRNSALVPNISAGGSFWLANGVSLSANVIGNGTNYCIIGGIPNAKGFLFGQSMQSTSLSAINNNTIYLSGYTFGGVASYTTSHIEALSSNLIFVNCTFPRPAFATTVGFVNFRGGGANTAYYLSANNCIIGDYSGVGNAGAVLTFSNSFPVGYFNNCNIGSSGGGSGAPGRGINFASTNGILYVVNCVLSSYPNTQWEGDSFQIGNTNTGYFDNCVLLGGGGASENCCAIDNGGLLYITNSSLRGGTAGHAIRNSGTCYISANNLFTGLGGAIINNTGTLSLFASASDLIANNFTNAIISTGSLSATVGNIINAPNGRQAIYAPRYQVFPSASPTYTRQAVNGYDSYVDYWTSNATFTYPASSDVVLNTTYNNNSLTGTMVLPPVSSVVVGCPVGRSVGTVSPLALETVLTTNINTLTASNSIGRRLKNISTTEALSSIVKSLTYNTN